MNQRMLLRGSALTVSLLFVCSLFLPAAAICGAAGSSVMSSGWSWLRTGVVGPIAGLFAWYANPLLIWSFFRMATRSVPNLIVSLLTPIAGFLSFVPATFQWLMDSAEPFHLCRWSWGMAFWLTALLVPLAAYIADRVGRRRVAAWLEPL
jgi:hypothetical protein